MGFSVGSMTDFASQREAMVERQLRRRGITEPEILDAFLEVPREAFVSAAHAHLAYGDHPLPIEAGQTISQPYIVALMIEAAEIKPGAKVLEIGSGSGYAAAVMSRIAARVIGVERQHELVEVARERLGRLGYDNVAIVEADGTKGWPDEAPYDAILAAASGSHVPKPLIDQLAPGGHIVMPVGDPGWVQKLIKVSKRADGSLQQSDLGAVRFVPLIGEEGWSDA
jgi:protein-L-isoaspartate(D-aspartate) O-methyltransferase